MSEPFGRYRLADCVGAGGMAEVFRASLDTEAGVEKIVCIKRILRTHSHDPAFVELFRDEARVALQLQHPNVVGVYDFGKVQDHWFMAMEWVDGVNLHKILHTVSRNQTQIPARLALYIAHEAAKGLHYAHSAKSPQGEPLRVVHRDVCPQNLLISFAGEVKVADFGIARSAASTSQTGDSIRGHVAYLSPEQALGGKLDARSDQFALGTVLYEMLAGKRLFKAEERLLTLERVREAKIPPLHRDELPPGAEAVMRKALARLPEDRFEDARAFQQALLRLLPAAPDALRDELADWLARSCGAARGFGAPPEATGSLELATTQNAPKPAPKVQIAARTDRRRWAAALLLLLGLLGVALWPRTSSPPAAPIITTPPVPTPVLTALPAPTPAPIPAPSPATAPEAAPKRTIVPELTPAPEPAPDPVPAAEPIPAPEPAPAPESPPTDATLTLRLSTGWGQIRIDGRRVKGGTPLVHHALPPGPHLVQVEEPSTGRVWSREVTLIAGESTELSFP